MDGHHLGSAPLTGRAPAPQSPACPVIRAQAGHVRTGRWKLGARGAFRSHPRRPGRRRSVEQEGAHEHSMRSQPSASCSIPLPNPARSVMKVMIYYSALHCRAEASPGECWRPPGRARTPAWQTCFLGCFWLLDHRAPCPDNSKSRRYLLMNAEQAAHPVAVKREPRLLENCERKFVFKSSSGAFPQRADPARSPEDHSLGRPLTKAP